MAQSGPTRTLVAKLAALVGAGLLVACGAVAQSMDMKQPGTAAEFLGEERVSIIASADRVEPFLLRPTLAPMPSGIDVPGTVAGYAWKARGADLAAAEVARFKALLLDTASYEFETAKKCPLVPEYAFRFHAGTRKTDVIVAFGCPLWAFPDADGIRVEDFDPVVEQLKEIVETVFKLD